MKLIPKNITLDYIKNSTYWKLISILVWNHYSEEKYQDESAILIEESWYGKASNSGSYAKKWDAPDYSEKGYIRTLKSIVITFTRTDYITYIYIGVDGNIYCFGQYTDKKDVAEYKRPNYNGAQRNLAITNWMIENDLICIE